MTLGVRCRLHDAATADDLGTAHLPTPVEPGDLVAKDEDTYVVVNVITIPPVGALVEAAPLHMPLDTPNYW